MSRVLLRAPIGQSLPRERARRFASGRGRYTDDCAIPRGLHAAFLRSPIARGDIVEINIQAARETDGVLLVLTHEEIAGHYSPWEANNQLLPDMKSPEQPALPSRRVNYVGEPLVMVVATSRAIAEDAVEQVFADIEPLEAVASIDAALDSNVEAIHEGTPDNVCADLTSGNGAFGTPFVKADLVLEETLDFGRHTACTLETRSMVADYDPSTGSLHLRISHQCPHQLQAELARILRLPQHRVRVSSEDVGGAYGLKQQLYQEDVLVCLAAMQLGRPVRFVADRMEAFASDNHAREHRVTARVAATSEGRITGFEIDDLFPIGAFPQYPRTSLGEGNHVLRMSAAGYDIVDMRSRLRLLFQNKALVGHYRSVGHPIACAITEHMVDRLARELRLAPEAVRRLNFHEDTSYPLDTPTGVHLHYLSQHACLDQLLSDMDIGALRKEQDALRLKGIYRGIGIASFVELTGTGNGFYGPGGIDVSGQDGCTLKMEPSGHVRCMPSVTDQGQGTDTGIAQIVASVLGCVIDDIKVLSGDSETSPHGGGAWASRGISTGGEAAWHAAMELRDNLLAVAGHLHQRQPKDLELSENHVVDADGTQLMATSEVAHICYFRHDILPDDMATEMTVTRHSVPKAQLFQATNGIQAAHVEVDIETGFVRLLEHWVVHDGGTLINPALVEEQIRGGVVQGLGAALWEEIRYDQDGQLLTASLADYLVPMASDVPDIHVSHVTSQTAEGVLGAKGVGEAGVAGASGAVLNAVNDALSPVGAIVRKFPISPRVVLEALWSGRKP
ncbi:MULTISPECIES: xanthine dehydrogenase family protein molybdopterin-binding subunit [unclassified Roseivivax]|uniref:xanthine dehydrogenase family protein molybdopterin-binding subunit n=1 Tax=unclassified Roseivivax TaxID=2639302 RepID=UPI0012691655|nr:MULTISPECIES: xanthine dehydrogenase family protein molybdopterin-binding subunit [unclassified Roseivivax]QFT48941.1 Caffeine dehydrogenase subunit alpha [Roseivivax sp. THAF40]QFT65095.1 Caffeine dehydrogenase subunit alpha [Roseivivax sp. THAF30]